MKDYKYILFDLDGTIVDSGLGITNAVSYALSKFGISVASREELFGFIGPPLMDSFQRFFGFSKEKAFEAVEQYRVYYRAKGLFENTVYEGVEEMLASLRAAGKRVILATAKPEEFAKTVIKDVGLEKYFSFIGGAEMESAENRGLNIRSKKEDVIAYVLSECGIEDKSSAVMVGDRENDIVGAKLNGIDSVGVLFGYGSLAELTGAGADHIAETPMEVVGAVCGKTR
ncbi:MAG: HAD hydrolase-like protein [Clostridia bacterium]|nr:HAD hydrolase-like protein [Clostridia bacterium]